MSDRLSNAVFSQDEVSSALTRIGKAVDVGDAHEEAMKMVSDLVTSIIDLTREVKLPDNADSAACQKAANGFMKDNNATIARQTQACQRDLKALTGKDHDLKPLVSIVALQTLLASNGLRNS